MFLIVVKTLYDMIIGYIILHYILSNRHDFDLKPTRVVLLCRLKKYFMPLFFAWPF